MKDLVENQLNVGDLVAFVGGYKRALNLGIIRKFTSNIHIYLLDRPGLALARKDNGLKPLPNTYSWTTYVMDGMSILKIPVSLLSGEPKTYYEEIMKILNKNVVTADNI